MEITRSPSTVQEAAKSLRISPTADLKSLVVVTFGIVQISAVKFCLKFFDSENN
jgi:hypothetical protein